ncbi:MAG: hypothetical protein H0T42_11885 [Deltaproteobacteria bacterium]|nr:hypothetical protein [Deltaproteobacteria bacterium]
MSAESITDRVMELAEMSSLCLELGTVRVAVPDDVARAPLGRRVLSPA